MPPFLRDGGEKNQDFMLVRFINTSDLIGCGGEHWPIRKLLGPHQVHARCTPGACQVIWLAVVGSIDQSESSWVHARFMASAGKVHAMSECKKVMHARREPCDLIGCGREHLPIRKLLGAHQVHARCTPCLSAKRSCTSGACHVIWLDVVGNIDQSESS